MLRWSSAAWLRRPTKFHKARVQTASLACKLAKMHCLYSRHWTWTQGWRNSGDENSACGLSWVARAFRGADRGRLSWWQVWMPPAALLLMFWHVTWSLIFTREKERKGIGRDFEIEKSMNLAVVCHVLSDFQERSSRLNAQRIDLEDRVTESQSSRAIFFFGAAHNPRRINIYIQAFCIYKPLWPVILVKASRYLLAVSATISSGMPTPSLPFWPELVSQSRRYCYKLSAEAQIAE